MICLTVELTFCLDVDLDSILINAETFAFDCFGFGLLLVTALDYALLFALSFALYCALSFAWSFALSFSLSSKTSST
jgi:hypothetical protein